MATINLSLLRLIMQRLDLALPYRFGAKLPLAASPEDLARRQPPVDCSGFTRYLVYHASRHSLLLPDGSVAQADFCRRTGYHRVTAYSHLLLPAVRADSSRLFLCFRPRAGSRANHVWLVSRGYTLESRGGLGVCAFPAASLGLHSDIQVYELPTGRMTT